MTTSGGGGGGARRSHKASSRRGDSFRPRARRSSVGDLGRRSALRTGPARLSVARRLADRVPHTRSAPVRETPQRVRQAPVSSLNVSAETGTTEEAPPSSVSVQEGTVTPINRNQRQGDRQKSPGIKVSGVRISPLRVPAVRIDEVYLPPISLPGTQLGKFRLPEIRIPGMTIRAGGLSPLRLPRVIIDENG